VPAPLDSPPLGIIHLEFFTNPARSPQDTFHKRAWCDTVTGMTLEVSTPALLFPAISLLFLSYTNRFLHLSALIRDLHGDWMKNGDATLRAQIDNLRHRLTLIRTMQMFGAVSLFLCVSAMLGVIGGQPVIAISAFLAALVLMAFSLACLIYEIWISGGALRILLNAVEGKNSPE
jgi:hypothetical protein